MGELLRSGRAAARRLAVLAPALSVFLAACPPQQDAGFDKVATRSNEPIARLARPDPPPVTPGLAGGAATGPVVAVNLPEGVTQEMVEEGQRLYGTVCVACHGAGGIGSPVGPALNDGAWIHITGTFDEIVHITTTGVQQPREFAAQMPALGGGNFTPDQVRAIAAYVLALNQQGAS
jgi:mono/diheme cytochrome c family protein